MKNHGKQTISISNSQNSKNSYIELSTIVIIVKHDCFTLLNTHFALRLFHILLHIFFSDYFLRFSLVMICTGDRNKYRGRTFSLVSSWIFYIGATEVVKGINFYRPPSQHLHTHLHLYHIPLPLHPGYSG